MSDVDVLNLGAWQERSRVCGPGERFVLWVQGCSLGCRDCINPEFLPFEDRLQIRTDELVAKILSTQGIEGVTYSGGEPMLQAGALSRLTRSLRRKGLTIVCYTGFTLEVLRKEADPWIQELLSQVDLVIDGPYLPEKATNLLWRGSSNQRLHFLTDAYRPLADKTEQARTEIELAIGTESFTTVGQWPQGFLERLQEKLREDTLCSALSASKT